MSKQEEFQKIIEYEFQDEMILKQALTHSSYANEKHIKKHLDNERLEFLGDAVLEVVTSEYLFLHYPQLSEGDLTKFRASLVCEPTLAACTPSIRLGDFILLGRGEDRTGGRKRKSILSDALEALIGAIYLDGGLTNAKEFILKFVLTDIENKKIFYDSKTILQEYVQSNYDGNLKYQIIGESGPDHDKSFTVEARIAGEVIGTGSGHTKKAAEQEAAYQALLKLDSNKLKELIPGQGEACT